MFESLLRMGEVSCAGKINWGTKKLRRFYAAEAEFARGLKPNCSIFLLSGVSISCDFSGT